MPPKIPTDNMKPPAGMPPKNMPSPKEMPSAANMPHDNMDQSSVDGGGHNMIGSKHVAGKKQN